MRESFTSSPDELRAEQLGRLRTHLPEVLGSNRFWRERLSDVRSWDDFERLPFLTKTELVRDQERQPPFGSNLTYEPDRYVRLHQTSGSGGQLPLRWLDTAESWDWWRRVWAESVYPGAGVTAADRVFLAFSFGPFIGFWSAFGGAERMGALAISGGAMTTEQRVRTMVDLGATVLLCTPTYALRLAETAQELGVDLASSAIRITIHAGEPGASVPAVRRAIEEAVGARCVDHTGMTELGPTGASCSAQDGVHLFENEFIFEVLDDEGRAHADGEGELVATNLGRWGSPLFRYRTGDRVLLRRDGCACGSPFVKAVGGVRGRVDDMFTVRGINLYPVQVEDVVRRYPAVQEFLIEHRKVRQLDEVTVLVEAEGSLPLDRLEADLRQALGARIGCRQVELGTLPRSELKSKRLRRLAEEDG
jgi:phenylacetate-CoA ligase